MMCSRVASAAFGSNFVPIRSERYHFEMRTWDLNHTPGGFPSGPWIDSVTGKLPRLADANRNGCVSIEDYRLVVKNLGNRPPVSGDRRADVNFDGIVNSGDQWLVTQSLGSSVSCPMLGSKYRSSRVVGTTFAISCGLAKDRPPMPKGVRRSSLANALSAGDGSLSNRVRPADGEGDAPTPISFDRGARERQRAPGHGVHGAVANGRSPFEDARPAQSAARPLESWGTLLAVLTPAPAAQFSLSYADVRKPTQTYAKRFETPCMLGKSPDSGQLETRRQKV